MIGLRNTSLPQNYISPLYFPIIVKYCPNFTGFIVDIERNEAKHTYCNDYDRDLTFIIRYVCQIICASITEGSMITHSFVNIYKNI